MHRTIATAALAGVASIGSLAATSSAAPDFTEVKSRPQVSESLVNYQQDGLPNLVTPGDPFTISVTAFNSVGGAIAAGPITANFGQQQTFPNAGLAGQTVTVTSSETINPTTTTDQITISVPNDFLPSGTTLGGQPPTSIFVEIGNENTAILPATPDPINFLVPISYPAGYTDQFTIIAGSATAGPFAFSETVGGGNTTLEGFGGVSAGGASLAGAGVRSFTVSFSYPNVPEPASLAAVGVAGATTLRRRRQRS